MKEMREVLESLDEITLNMIDAVKSEKIGELEKLFKKREKLLKEAGKYKDRVPEAELSKLLRDSERLTKALKMMMEKTKKKIEEISKNIELIRGYAVKKDNFHINERR